MVKSRLIPKLRFPEFTNLWSAGVLGDFANIKRGAGSQYLTYTSESDNAIRLIRISDFLDDNEVYIKNTKDIGRFILGKNDILIAGTGATAGITFMVPLEFHGMAFSYNAPRIRIESNLVHFVYQYLQSDLIKKQQWRLFTGNAQPFLDTKSISNFKINLPSLPEQQKIADFLSAVDKKIELLTRKKELLEQYKKGVMQKLFSQEIRFKDEQGRSFPEWERVRLGDVANIVGGGTPDTSEESYWNGEINWFTPTEIKGKYLTKSKRTISQKGLKNSSAKLLPTGTILFTSRATIGDVGFAMIECSTNQGFQSLVVNPEYSSEFIYQLVLYKKKEFLRKAQGSTFIEISSKTMKKMRFNIPVLQEQDKIADFLSSIDKKIELVQNQIKTTQTFKKGLLQQMFV